MNKLFKKTILLLIVSVFGLVSVNASSLSVSLDCGDKSVSAGETITCTIKATPSDFTLRGIQAKYTFTNGTYSSFVPTSGFTSQSSSDTAKDGFMLTRATGTSSSVSVGTLKVKAGNEGPVTIKLSSVEASDSSYGTVTASDVTDSVRISSSVNTLNSLVLTANDQVVPLTPSFDKNTTSYKATVDSATVRITTEKTDSNSLVSGSGTKDLDYGENVLKVIVTSESGSKKTYTLTITRPDNREDVNTLSSIKLSIGTLSPTFVSSTTSYKSTVDAATDEIKITTTLTSSKSTYVKNYGPRTVDLEYGSNKILIKVKSEKGNIKTYTIDITRTDSRSSNNYLSSLTIESQAVSFNKDKTEYVVSVNNGVSKINISATAEDSKATIKGTGEVSLKVGLNTVNVIVTAENGSKKTYILKVTRLEKDITKTSGTDLATLDVIGYELGFDPNITEYSLTLTDDVTTLPVNYTTTEEGAQVTIEGNENLINGSIVNLIVTAADGTSKTYAIRIVKETNTPVVPDDNTKKNDSEGLSKGAIIGIISLAAILIIIVVFVLVLKKRKESQM